MKAGRVSGPLALWLVTLALVAWLVRDAWRVRAGNQMLRASAPAARGVPASSASGEERAVPQEVSPLPELSAENLRAETQREIAARAVAEAQIAELEKRLPPREGEVLVSFGRIEQMAQRTAMVLRMGAIATAATATEAQQAEISANLPEFLGQLGELGAMENNPPEIARFQAATLRDILGLDAAATARATAFLETEFARLKIEGLTATFRPEKETAEWDRRRDAAMTEVAARLRPLLPAGHAQLPLLPGILSLGGGLRTEVKMNPDGHGSVRMTLPLMPRMLGM